MDLLDKRRKKEKRQRIAETFINGFGKEGLEDSVYTRELNIFIASIAIKNPNRLLDRLSTIKGAIKFAKSIDENIDDYNWDGLIRQADNYNIITSRHNALVLSEKIKKFIKDKPDEIKILK